MTSSDLPHPWSTLIPLAQNKVDLAMIALAKALEARNLLRLQKLEDEHRHHQAKEQWAHAAQQGITGAAARNHQLYLEGLENAAKLHLEQQFPADRAVEQAQQTYAHERATLEGYRTLLKQRQKQEQRRQNRQDQNETDEFAARPRDGYGFQS